MSEHKTRVSDLSRWVAPPEGSSARARLDAWAVEQKKDPGFENKLRKSTKRRTQSLGLKLETGAGLPMDQLVGHARLDQYRINPKREFFQAPYKIIFQAIDDVIKKLEKGT